VKDFPGAFPPEPTRVDLADLTKPAKQIINWRIANNPQGCKEVTMRQGVPTDDEKLALSSWSAHVLVPTPALEQW